MCSRLCLFFCLSIAYTFFSILVLSLQIFINNKGGNRRKGIYFVFNQVMREFSWSSLINVVRVLVETVLDRPALGPAQDRATAPQAWTVAERQGTIFWVLLAHGAVAPLWAVSLPAQDARCRHRPWVRQNTVAQLGGQKGCCIKECLWVFRLITGTCRTWNRDALLLRLQTIYYFCT